MVHSTAESGAAVFAVLTVLPCPIVPTVSAVSIASTVSIPHATMPRHLRASKYLEQSFYLDSLPLSQLFGPTARNFLLPRPLQTFLVYGNPRFRRATTDDEKVTMFLSRKKDRSVLLFYQNGEEDDYNPLKRYFLEALLLHLLLCNSTTLRTNLAEERNLRRGDISS
jgi:hypothetical protein